MKAKADPINVTDTLRGFHFYCERNDRCRFIGVDIFKHGTDDTVEHVVSQNVRTEQAGDFVAEPSMALSFKQAGELMDELWRCGVRPAAVNLRSLTGDAAQGAHLADMRAIVFAQLSLEQP